MTNVFEKCKKIPFWARFLNKTGFSNIERWEKFSEMNKSNFLKKVQKTVNFEANLKQIWN